MHGDVLPFYYVLQRVRILANLAREKKIATLAHDTDFHSHKSDNEQRDRETVNGE